MIQIREIVIAFGFAMLLKFYIFPVLYTELSIFELCYWQFKTNYSQFFSSRMFINVYKRIVGNTWQISLQLTYTGITACCEILFLLCFLVGLSC